MAKLTYELNISGTGTLDDLTLLKEVPSHLEELSKEPLPEGMKHIWVRLHGEIREGECTYFVRFLKEENDMPSYGVPIPLGFRRHYTFSDMRQRIIERGTK